MFDASTYKVLYSVQIAITECNQKEQIAIPYLVFTFLIAS